MGCAVLFGKPKSCDALHKHLGGEGMMEKSALEEQMVSMLTKGLLKPKISVVGCGGAGNNIIHSIYWNSKSEVETVAVNTDETKLEKVDAHKKVLIGKDITHGKGAGGFPEVGEYCAECARSIFEDILSDSDIVFVIAGMGGGTGTGAAPIVAKTAKDLGAVTFAIAINPFSNEADRCRKAMGGIEKLKQVTQTTIVLENDRLLEIAGDLALRETFSIMERSILRIIESVDNKISESFLTQIESDVREMLEEMNEEEIQTFSHTDSPTPSIPLNSAESYGEYDPSAFDPGFETAFGPN
jgi:cell division protein FtsZ